MNALKELMIEKAEELGWQIIEDDVGADIGQFSGAGEDFWFYVRYKTPLEMSDAVNDYYENFDPEEHAALWYGKRGAPGLRALLDDADGIDDMLRELAATLSGIVEEWYLEHDDDGTDV